MQLAVSHRWDLSIGDAKSLQVELAQKVIRVTTFDPFQLQTVAGVDAAFRASAAMAAAVVLGFPGLGFVDCSRAEVPLTFPYVPGLLAFREGPALLSALERLTVWPDLLIVDAHGLAHPRRFGLASYMGVVLDLPTIGCAKSRLVGKHDEPGNQRGDWVPLTDDRETIGAVLRTAGGRKPVYVSIGHRVDLTTAIDLVLRCTRDQRLPETTRFAHRLAGGGTVGPVTCRES